MFLSHTTLNLVVTGLPFRMCSTGLKDNLEAAVCLPWLDQWLIFAASPLRPCLSSKFHFFKGSYSLILIHICCASDDHSNSSDFQYAVGLGVNCCSTGSEDSGSGAATSSNSYHNQSNSEISSATSIHLNQASSLNCHLPLATILHPSTLKLSLAQDALYDQYIPSVRIFHLHYLHKMTVAIPQKFYLSQRRSCFLFLYLIHPLYRNLYTIFSLWDDRIGE